MQTIGDLIDKIIDINVEHFNGTSYSKEAIRSKIFKIPGARKYYYRVLNPVQKKVQKEDGLLPKLTNEEYKILMVIADQHNVEIGQLVSKSRKREVVDARMQAMVIFYVYLFYTFKRAGNLFLRDHSTVIHAVETSNDLFQTNEGYTRSFAKTLERVKEEVPHLFETNHKVDFKFKEMFARRKMTFGIGELETPTFKEEVKQQKQQIKKLLQDEETY